MTPYASLQYCNNYFATERLNSNAWFNSSVPNQNAALIMGTRIIDRFNFAFDKTVSTQENEFPRSQYYADLYDTTITQLTNTTIPDSIIRANAEIALYLLDGWDPDLETSNLGVVSQGVSSVKMTYDPNNIPIYVQLGLPSQTVWNLIRPFVRDPGMLKLHRV